MLVCRCSANIVNPPAVQATDDASTLTLEAQPRSMPAGHDQRLEIERIQAEERLEAARLARYKLELEHKQQETMLSHQLQRDLEKARLEMQFGIEQARLEKEAATKLEVAKIEAEARVLAAKAGAEASSHVAPPADTGSAMQGVMNLFATMLANQTTQLAEMGKMSESRKRRRDEDEHGSGGDA